jgi:hypothetical protein
VRDFTLWGLAEHFRDDPETKSLLQARAVEDSDTEPRATALRGLAEYFRDDPETKPLLQTRAVRSCTRLNPLLGLDLGEEAS